jgi:hypothetical protein
MIKTPCFCSKSFNFNRNRYSVAKKTIHFYLSKLIDNPKRQTQYKCQENCKHRITIINRIQYHNRLQSLIDEAIMKIELTLMTL